jgi:hypothetical protein
MTRSNSRPLLLAVLVLAGCGGGEEDKTAPFVGTWTVTMGTLSGTCPILPMPIMQNLAGGQQIITKTADGALSVSIISGCNIIFDVTGNVANLRVTTPPQSCNFTFNMLPVMGTFTGATFTVNGQTASFNYAGTGMLGTIACPVTGVGTSMKGVPADGGSSTQPDTGISDGP